MVGMMLALEYFYLLCYNRKFENSNPKIFRTKRANNIFLEEKLFSKILRFLDTRK